MRIQRLDLIRYGKFTDRRIELPRSPRDIHLIVGPNEAGKSTVRTAIRDWLFGIPMRTPFAFLHPMPELRLGGILERPLPRSDARPVGRASGASGGDAEAPVPAGEPSGEALVETLVFERTKGNRNTLRGAGDLVLPEGTLRDWLGSLEAETFGRLHALDHAALIEGGAGLLSASDDLGRMLFQSAAGIEHLGAVLSGLDTEAGECWAPRRSGSRAYYIAFDAHERAREDLKSAMLRRRDWESRHAALKETGEALTAARLRHAELRAELVRLERLRRVRPMIVALDPALQRRSALFAEGDAPLLPEDAMTVLNTANRDLAVNQAAIDRHLQDIARASAELGLIAVDGRLLATAQEIEELNARRQQFRQHRVDILKRTEEIRLEWQRAQELANGLGWSVVDEDGLRRRLPARGARERLSRLLRERVSLDDRLQSTRRNLQTRLQDLGQARATLDALPPATVSPALELAVEQARRLGDVGATMAACDAQIEQIRASLGDGLEALGEWRADPPVLRAMVVPDIGTVRMLQDEERADLREMHSLQDAVAARHAEEQRLELELRQLIQAFRPVSQAQVIDARQRRQADWEAIKDAPQELPRRAAGFEQRIAEADQLADDRHERARHEADRQAGAARLEAHRMETQTQQSRVDGVQSRRALRAVHWERTARACGLPGLPLEAATDWLSRRERALALSQELDAALRRRAGLVASVEATVAALDVALTDEADAVRPESSVERVSQRSLATTSDDTDAAPPTGTAPIHTDAAALVRRLAERIRQARERIARADESRGLRQALGKQLADGNAALAALQAAEADAGEAWRRWEVSWQDAIQEAGYGPSALADRVEAEVGTMEEIARRLDRIESIRVERIDTMQADLDGLAGDAGALASRIAPDLLGRAPEDIAMALAERLAQARQAQEAHDGWQTRLSTSEQALDDARQTGASIRARLAPLLTTAGTSDPDRLGQAIERSDRRRTLEESIGRLQAELEGASDGFGVDQLREQAASIDPALLVVEIERINAQTESVVEEIAALGNRHGKEKSAFDAFDGADAAALAEARRQEAIAAMTEAIERYLKLNTAARLLKWSIEKFRETRQGPMLARASALFATLTLGSFSRLLVDGDGQSPRLLGVRPGGALVDVAGMSEGSRDQLYLALRLAALELQAEQGTPMPLIADDLFVNFDDDRTAAGLRVLGELSTRLQVVFLTHHEHLVPLARSVLGDSLNVTVL
ncbi:MAG: hypothetical protein RIS35_2577 [Pseudomonadota bacterium]|jgi:uncharacterized protein YhaN